MVGHGMLFRNRIAITLIAHTRRKITCFFNAAIRAGLSARMRMRAKFRSSEFIAVGHAARLYLLAVLKFAEDVFAVGMGATLKLKGVLKSPTRLAVTLVTKSITRRYRCKHSDVVGVRNNSKCRRRTRVVFDNQRLTIYTVTLLKALTIGQLKGKPLGQWKQVLRYMPNFRVELTANLKQRSET